MFGSAVRVAVILAGLALAPPIGLPVAAAEPDQQPGTPSLPVFVPYPSNWQPNYTVFPYNLWQNRVTPEQLTAQRESCQWINAQYDVLMSQALGFQRFLGDRRDDWSAPGVREAAGVVAANLDQSAAFLQPRADTLYIVNYPDQSEYSPLFHGDSIYRLWYQLTQISDKIKREVPAGQINANVATAHVYGGAIRGSGVCNGA
ncbi:hypothetical protein JRC04_17155 [Mycolicibacterium sp. S2-37]|uniref:hypothetical protein n=1 Tax=Mycolicibacterium sp. S2-37 TaxID=2810297 RepID=UPI001A94E788|nr:hypothetical protein [Mycolicibacterium sp. S2-37]MBO0679195.1 hypothetical protein [Mycolicibacterium sp. S2-37]